MKKLFFVLFVAVLLAVNTVSVAAQGTKEEPKPSQNKNQTPQIHALFVWGTNDKSIYWVTKVCREKIVRTFNEPAFTNLCLFDYYRLPEDKAGLIPKSEHIGSFVELEGDNAHPTKILEECRKISQKADINDAVFVYMLCPSTGEYGEDDHEQKNKVHVLSPVCTNAKNPDIHNIGIQRSSIMREIKSKPHRLDVLITDSCFTQIIGAPEYVTICRLGRDPEHKISKLEKLLLNAHGTINIHSFDFNKGSRHEELTPGWIPTIEDDKQEYLERASNNHLYSGTVFTNAFVNLALTEIPKDEEYSAEDFIKELKHNLKEEFNETINWLKEKYDNSIETKQLLLQETQTLTQFDDLGVTVP
ncbi:MAG: hypothetical protein LBC20_00910 [Planctomycetaceae bacterium]|jgi:hypothetical protein|nr:hypothetical protein [Planctomycetaceae bacterium]